MDAERQNCVAEWLNWFSAPSPMSTLYFSSLLDSHNKEGTKTLNMWSKELWPFLSGIRRLGRDGEIIAHTC